MRVTAPDGSVVTNFHRPGYWHVIKMLSRGGLQAIRKTWPAGASAGDEVQIESRKFTVDRYKQVIIESKPMISSESLYELAAHA